MNVLRFAVAAATAALVSPAFAQSDAAAPAPGLTRAEVIAQLKQAYLDGELPTNDGNYPPNAATRARNRELVQAVQPSWLAHAPLQAPHASVQQ